MIYFVDFEASSLLPGSFPIEVAWVNTHGQGESYLIRPLEAWLDGGGWSRESEAVHGISLDTLTKNGVPVERVAKRAADALSSRRVMACSDAPEFDGSWMEALLGAGERNGRAVRLLDVQQIYGWTCRPLLDGLAGLDSAERERAEQEMRNTATGIIARAQEVEALHPRIHHRALSDAESLWRTWRAVREEVERHAG